MGAPVDPLYRQQSFAFYDDGTEAGSAIIGAVDTSPTLDNNKAFLLRFLLQEYNGASKNPDFTAKLQFNLNAAGWLDVTGGSDVRYEAANTPVDGDPTTQRIGAGAFVTGRYYESVNNAAIWWNSNGNDETEILFGLRLDQTVLVGADTIQFRVVQGGGTLLDTYTSTPTVTVDQPLYRQQSFAFYADGTEAGSAIIGSIDTNITLPIADKIFQLRFSLQEYGATTTNPDFTAKLLMGVNGGVELPIDNTTPILFNNFGVPADGSATTQRVGTGTFVQGKFFKDVPLLATPWWNSNGNDETEVVFSLKVDSAAVTDGDEFKFLVVFNDGRPLNTYINFPLITIVGTPVINVPIGLTTESSTTQQIDLPLARLINQSLENELAQLVSGASALNLPVGLISETDLTQLILVKKTLSLGLLSETNTTLAVATLKLLTLGLPSEATIALLLEVLKKVTLNLPLETEESFTLTKEKSKLLNIVNENTVNFSLTGAVTVSLGLPTQAEVGQTLLSLKALQLGLTNETNSTQTLTKLKSLLLNFITETETAQSNTFVKTYPILGQTNETDLTQTATATSALLVNQINEAASAQTLSSTLKTYLLAQALETDNTFLLTQLKDYLLLQAIESNTALQMLLTKDYPPLGLPFESNISQAILSAAATEVLQVTENNSLNPITKLKEKVITLAIESDATAPVEKPINKVLSLIIEADTASNIIIPLGLVINNAVELSLTQVLNSERSYAISAAVEVESSLSFQLTVTIDVVPSLETDASTSSTINRSITLQFTAELESGFSLSKEKTYLLTEALETNLAFLATNPDAIDWCLANKTLTLISENKHTLILISENKHTLIVTFSSNTIDLN